MFKRASRCHWMSRDANTRARSMAMVMPARPDPIHRRRAVLKSARNTVTQTKPNKPIETRRSITVALAISGFSTSIATSAPSSWTCLVTLVPVATPWPNALRALTIQYSNRLGHIHAQTLERPTVRGGQRLIAFFQGRLAYRRAPGRALTIGYAPHNPQCAQRRSVAGRRFEGLHVDGHPVIGVYCRYRSNRGDA